MTWRIASTVLVLVVVAATLLYFRPTIISLVVNHGGGQPDDEIAAQMRRWVMLNGVRLTAVAVSIGMGVGALLRSAGYSRPPYPRISDYRTSRDK
jgi:hypothetical protein